MFTGLISAVGEVTEVEDRGEVRRLRIRSSYDPASISMGASIAHSGICLTAIDMGHDWFDVEAAAETLNLTTLAYWTQGTRINLERSLKIGDELGGHVVTGHIDGVAEILERHETGQGTAKFMIQAPSTLSRYIAAKGSVALDGTSLTVNEVDGDILSVLLIPHTLKVTTWGERRAGDRLNLEVDLMARYAARLAGYV